MEHATTSAKKRLTRAYVATVKIFFGRDSPSFNFTRTPDLFACGGVNLVKYHRNSRNPHLAIFGETQLYIAQIRIFGVLDLGFRKPILVTLSCFDGI